MNKIQEMQACVRSGVRILPVGQKTKPGLLSSAADTVLLPTHELDAIVTYDPSEFLITAKAGTKVQTLHDALAEHGQYLPFDPMWIENGSTIGGTIASGISGPRQLLHGSLRDFVMEVQFIDGLGNLVRGGGKVVKNSAGFDLPKLMTGSCGRMGVLTEVTLKVLPEPSAYQNFRVACESFADAVQCIQSLRKEPLPIASLEIDQLASLHCEMAGLESALPSVVERANQVLRREDFQTGTAPCRPERGAESGNCFLRIVASPSNVAEFASQVVSSSIEIGFMQISAAGTLVWLGLEKTGVNEELSTLLRTFGYSAVELMGQREEMLVLGNCDWKSQAQLLQKAVDPGGKFLNY